MKDISTTSAHIFIMFVIFTKLNVHFLVLNTIGASKQHLLLVKSEIPKKHKSDYFHSITKSRVMFTVKGYIKKCAVKVVLHHYNFHKDTVIKVKCFLATLQYFYKLSTVTCTEILVLFPWCPSFKVFLLTRHKFFLKKYYQYCQNRSDEGSRIMEYYLLMWQHSAKLVCVSHHWIKKNSTDGQENC